jgi:Subtilase family/Secretion system C-terminal sorting domain
MQKIFFILFLLLNCLFAFSQENKNNYKYATSNLWKQKNTATNKIAKYIITSSNIDTFLKNISQFSTKEINITFIHKDSKSIIVECTLNFLQKSIATLNEVVFISTYENPNTEVAVIGYKRHFNKLNKVDFDLPNANGNNIIVGVKEQKMEPTDIDIIKRILPSSIAATTIEAHATTISTLIGGAGNTFYDGRGIAHQCKFFSSSFANLFADDASLLQQNKVSVQNHSYGTIIQQFYGAEAFSYDTHTWNNKNFVHIFSSGNRGAQSPTDGQYAGIPNFANLTGNFKMAKNIITVGAIDDNGNIADASSAGPIYDGRLAPQITALGPNGTSDAAALVTGTVAVMQQVYADSNSNTLPPASLIKAALYNTATNIYTKNIDYKTGFGLLNSYDAVKTILQKKYEFSNIINGQVWTKNIVIPANCAALKITLCWTDSVSAINNSKALINDLDLVLIENITGITYKPWVLNNYPNKDSLNKIATRKRDSLNTAEQISIDVPNPGNYQIKIIGYNIPNAPMPFSLAYNLDTLNTFTFTNPTHTSDVNKQEDEFLSIRWKTFVADTNQTGNLQISYNNGANWNTIASNIKIYKQLYKWQTKDTTTIAQLKMETAFGNYESKSFIISPVCSPMVDYLCADSFRLSWNKHIYANNYKVFALTDSSHLKPLLNTIDTFITINRTNFPFKVFAIEPLLSNAIPAARSVGFNIEEQGVNCFYKTFNYFVLDSSYIELSLQLSITDAIDTIFFERVNSNQLILQSYKGFKVSNFNTMYSFVITNAPSGINYCRAKIKLKNGSIIYTEILKILITGAKQIILYPNPTQSGNTISYLLKSQTKNFNLQLFDIQGKAIKNWDIRLAGKLKLPNLPSGAYLFKLKDENNEIYEAFKLIIY